MRNLFIIFITFLVSSSVSYSQEIQYIDSEAVGIGKNREESIENAIIQCVAQVNGLTIETKKQLDAVEKVSNDESYSSELFKKRVRSATKGVVASYNVLSINKTEDAMFEAKVHAKIAKYNKGIGADRLRVAVLPFKVKDKYDISGENIESSDVARISTQTLVNKLVATRKFTVLDREYAADVEFEKDFIASNDVALEEMCKIGQVLGADYIIVGVIESLTSKKVDREIKLANLKLSVNKAGCSVTFRFIDVATKQIKFSSIINSNLDIDSSEIDSKIMAIFDDFSEQAIKKIVDNIYPLRVIAYEFGEVVLNQGGDSINEGDKYELFAMGSVLKDPYTGESLGRKETKCGVIEIIRVKGKTSDGKVLESSNDLSEIFPKSEIVCRLIKEKKENLTAEKINERKNLW